MLSLFIKPTGRGEFVFKELTLEGVDDRFWLTSGSSGVFKDNFFSGPCLIVSGQPDTKGAFH